MDDNNEKTSDYFRKFSYNSWKDEEIFKNILPKGSCIQIEGSVEEVNNNLLYIKPELDNCTEIQLRIVVLCENSEKNRRKLNEKFEERVIVVEIGLLFFLFFRSFL